MVSEESVRRSRRAMLAGGLAAFGALWASALGRPPVVRSTNGDPVLVGQTASGTLPTQVTSSGNGPSIQGQSGSSAGVGVFGYAAAADGATWGVWGQSQSPIGSGVVGTANSHGTGVLGFSGNGPVPVSQPKTGMFGIASQDSLARGVYGLSGPGTGVFGESTSSSGRYGVRGRSAATAYPAILGHSTGNSTGVVGFSGGIAPAAPATTGVYGLAGQNANATGVLGESGTGYGVRGVSHSAAGFGVLGLADNTGSGQSFGVFARSSSTQGVGLGARAAANGTGVLAVSGSGTFPTAKAKTGVYGYAAQDNNSKAIWGHSPTGRGVQGSTTSGYAGYFSEKVFTTKFYELAEIASAPAPATNRARLFVRDNGAGKTQLCVRFHTGAVRVLATEP